MDNLITQIREIFKDDHINTEDIKRVLEAYKSNPLDWQKYAHFDPHKYTRNLVDIGNGKYNMLILCWGPGMGSSIHDHTNSHCFVKVLEGSLLETRFSWPDPDKSDEPMQETDRDEHPINGVTYMSDELGLHRMENPSHSDNAVTLHLYIPPFEHCQIFDERTGRKAQSAVTFFTKYGEKVDYRGSKLGRTFTLSSSSATPSSSSMSIMNRKVLFAALVAVILLVGVECARKKNRNRDKNERPRNQQDNEEENRFESKDEGRAERREKPEREREKFSNKNEQDEESEEKEEDKNKANKTANPKRIRRTQHIHRLDERVAEDSDLKTRKLRRNNNLLQQGGRHREDNLKRTKERNTKEITESVKGQNQKDKHTHTHNTNRRLRREEKLKRTKEVNSRQN
uniref:cysteine dioxygenase n=1 Tax=Acrobeloides nanus TaxID=290746 RepID=A0A914C806_9BILA